MAGWHGYAWIKVRKGTGPFPGHPLSEDSREVNRPDGQPPSTFV